MSQYIDLIRNQFHLDLESAYYYKNNGVLPEPILKERIDSFIEEYVENPNCKSPKGVTDKQLQFIEIYLD